MCKMFSNNVELIVKILEKKNHNNNEKNANQKAIINNKRTNIMQKKEKKKYSNIRIEKSINAWLLLNRR